MGNAGTAIGQPPALKFTGSPVVAPSLDAVGRTLVPRRIGLGIGGPQLLFGVKAIGELVELQVGLYRRHAADQHDQNPFHRSTCIVAGLGRPETARTCRRFHGPEAQALKGAQLRFVPIRLAESAPRSRSKKRPDRYSRAF